MAGWLSRSLSKTLSRSRALLPLSSLVAVACLDRPVGPATPDTTSLFIDQLVVTRVDKIDLLFMIDNSISMGDKQAILKLAVPLLVRRLVDPPCVSETDRSLREPANGADCRAGFAREFPPVSDIHIGIISSSLGGHGGDVCDVAQDGVTPSSDDQAHLIGSLDRGLGTPTWQNHGFLAWDPKQKLTPPGEPNADNLVSAFQDLVVVAGENGCGFEASLEAWYRFLIDPEPPAQVRNQGGVAVVEGIDSVVLAQRERFLRPDSLVAVVMLSDENDCSIVDGGPGWIAGLGRGNLPRATSVCASDPTSACCRSCGIQEPRPPTGCAPLAEDSECKKGTYDSASDHLNLRCFDQKRRFGIDLLHPISRYVDGLKSLTIQSRNGEPVKNPLYSDLAGSNLPPRDPSLVYLAGILGVPWQDIATSDSLAHPTALEYLTAREIPWDVVLGDRERGRQPLDPLMIESVDPRNPALTSVVTGAPIAPPDSPSATTNPINGHEFYVPKRDDLQYACTFPLDIDSMTPGDQPRLCTGDNCDCDAAAIDQKKPLCQDPATGAYGTTQFFAKAYPGVRQLEVLKGYGENSIVASICPKLAIGDPSVPSFGYNPAVDAIVSRIAEPLGRSCLSRALDPATDGTVPCAVVEAIPPRPSESCDACEALGGRATPDSRLIRLVRNQVEARGRCGGTTGIPCESLCMCEIVAAGSGSDGDCSSIDSSLEACQCQENPGVSGYCYVDPDAGIGSAELIKGCPATRRRRLLIVGTNDNPTPRSGATVFLACLGAEFGPETP